MSQLKKPENKKTVAKVPEVKLVSDEMFLNEIGEIHKEGTDIGKSEKLGNKLGGSTVEEQRKLNKI